MMEKQSVLFVCTHNSARSQMAEGLLGTRMGDRYEAYSAGTHPGRVHPLAIAAMKEIGIDISGHQSEHVDVYTTTAMDHVITVCDSARESCPYVPAKRQNIHHSFTDPSAADGSDEDRLEAFRRIRDEIDAWIADTFL